MIDKIKKPGYQPREEVLSPSSVRKIGILGGIGPEATGEFYTKLIKKLQESGLVRKNTDYPQIVINSIPAPELIFDKISEEELRPYINGLRELDEFGVDAIAMVCNTIHLYFETLQNAIETPLIDLRQEIKRELERDGIQSITVIGTPNTIRCGLYKFEGIRSLDPNDDEISELSDAIYNFNLGIDTQQQIQRVEAIAKQYLDKGAEKVVLGCTEFAVMLKDTEIPAVNTIDVLVNSLAEMCSRPK